MPIAPFRTLVAVFVNAVAFVSTAFAQTETVLHHFSSDTGYYPYSSVTADGEGNLYGATPKGGTSGYGAVYRVDSSGQYTVLYSFTGGADGRASFSDLLRDTEGNLFGTTFNGGTTGCGTVFRLDPNGHETVLHSFAGKQDGCGPGAGVTADASGNLYGSTEDGGTAGLGIVFRLNPNGDETVLHTFTGGVDGANPTSGVILDPTGNIYGATFYGATSGVIYKVNPDGEETLLHNFSGGSDGRFPAAGVIRDGEGALYGTTYEGGDFGLGVVFKLSPNGTEAVLHSFGATPTDGIYPESVLSVDSFGNLYGTTSYGGAFGQGTIYRIDALSHQESIVYSFDGFDGTVPNGRLLPINGNIYGTTHRGGKYNEGVIFKITLAP